MVHTGNPLGIGHTGNRSDHEHSVPRRDSNTHRETIPLRHTDPGEHYPASMIRHRRSRSRSRSYDSVSPRRHSRFPSHSRGKKSHEKMKHSFTSSSSSRHSFSSFLEKEKESGTSLKRRRRNTLNHVCPNVTRVRRSRRGRGALLHLLLLRLLQFLQTLLLLFRDIGLWASVTAVTLQTMNIQSTDYSRLGLIL